MKKIILKYVTLIFALLIGIGPITAQQTYKSERNADIVEYTSRDGLPTSNISSVAQTPDGYIWLASPQGTVRFDGYEFAYVGQEYGVPDMQAVFYDSLNNSLYFASPEKFIRLSEGEFTVLDESDGYKINGASGQVISFIKSDSRGRIWIGSETPFTDMPFNGGLTLYNKGRFTPFDSLSFPLHNAIGFIETPYGDLIFSSSGKNSQNGEGAYIALFKGNRFTLIDESVGINLVNANLGDGHFESAVDNRGNTWIAFNGIFDFALDKDNRRSGVLMYDGDRFHRFPGLQPYIQPMSFVGSVFFDKKQGKVLATIYSKTSRGIDSDQVNLFEFNGKDWVPSPINEEILSIRNLRSGQAMSQFRFSNVDLIAASRSLPACVVLSTKGLVASSEYPSQYFSLDEGVWKKYEAMPGFPLLDLKKGLMLKTTKGIAFYHPEESRMLTEEDGLAAKTISIPNFYVDRNQVVWMSFSYSAIPSYAETKPLGLNVWDGNRLRKLTTDDGLSGDATFNFLHDTQDRLWLGTSRGITQIREFRNTKGEWVFKFKKIPSSSGQIYNATTLLETKTGDLYAWQNYVHPAYGNLEKASFYLARFDGSRFEEIPSPFPDSLQKKPFQLFSLREDRSGRIWLEGHFSDRVNGLNSVGTEIRILKDGLWRAPPDSWRVPAAQLHFVGELENGSYYLTSGHFYKFDGTRFRDISDSVSTNADFRILKGASVAGTKTDIQVGDYLYIRLRNRGLVIFDGNVLRFYTPRDGFVATDIHDPIEDMRGNLFFASRVGAVMINGDNFRIFYDDENISAGGPNAVTIDGNGNFFKYYNGIGLYIERQTKANINLKITSLAVNGQNHYYRYPAKLSHENNSLLFNYSALNYQDPSKTTFEHILEGYDKEWSKPSGTSFAEYQNLPAGNFIFRVRARTANGFATEETALELTISPPWWNTWWAYALYAVLIVGLLYTVRRIELRRQRKNVQIKESRLRAEAAELKARAAESQARLVQMESERKNKELEEARQLQLSMLPKKLPELAHLDIAVYIKPATEVGGDYYDFCPGKDGSLTVAVGDATGHGLNAGMMVTATKSLFESLAGKTDTVTFMKEANQTLKKMNLENLKMAFTLVSITDHHFSASVAGMPPIMVYRQASNTLEEIVFEGMPLGSLANFPYEEKRVDLAPGDKIILMSDGFPERQNPAGEMLDYPAAYQAILDSADKSPQEMVEYLVQKGDDWANGRPQDDDVTFVVIKVK